MPYEIDTRHPDCRGYAVVKVGERDVLGCHDTRREAQRQIVALNIAEAEQSRALPDNYRPALSEDVPEGRACGNCSYYNEEMVQQDGEDLLAYCTLWDAYVNGGYYCNRWEPVAVRQEGYAPNDAMVAEARRGLEWRRVYGRGGTEVGVARARDIVNRRNLSRTTVARIASFLARHEVDKQAEGFRPGEPGYPSAGRIAWALWGGDPARSWAASILAEMRSLTERTDIR